MPDLEYNRRMDQMDRELAGGKRRLNGEVTAQPYQYRTEVNLLSALFDSEFWHTDVVPRVMDIAKAVSDKEFYTEDVANHAPGVLKTAAKGAAAGVAGAPMDLATLAAHTLWWASDNIGLTNRGHYDWLKDMPDFTQMPGTSDWIGKNIFKEDPQSMQWIFGSILTPDAALLGKLQPMLAMMWGGPIVARGRLVEKYDRAREPVMARMAIDNYDEAKAMQRLGATNAEMLERTGWIVGPEGTLRLFIDPVNAKFDWDIFETKAAQEISRVKATNSNLDRYTMRISPDEWLDWKEWSDIYPDVNQKMDDFTFFKPRPGQEDKHNYFIDVDGERWELGPTRGASFSQYPTLRDSKITIGGWAVPGDPPSREALRRAIESNVVHEHHHLQSALENMGRGGNTAEFEWELTKKTTNNMTSQILMDTTDALRKNPDLLEHPSVLNQAIGAQIDQYEWTRWAPGSEKQGMIDEIRRQAMVAAEDEFEYQTMLEMAKRDEKNLTEYLGLFAGKVPEEELVAAFTRAATPGAIGRMSWGMYYTTVDEVSARMAEHMWEYRDQIDPRNFDFTETYQRILKEGQNRPESKIPQSILDTGLTQRDTPIIRTRQDVDITQPEYVTDPLNPGGPIFDAGRETQRTLGNRGGTTGGLLDSSWEERPSRNALPEGTNQSGTLETLFPPLDNSDEWVPEIPSE